jgi:hypothetical protein
MAEEPTGATVEYRLRWTEGEDVPVLLTNQFLGQIGQQNEVVLTFGQVTLPALLGSPEQQAEQAKEISQVPVSILGRFTVSRAGLDELIRVLNDTRANYDRVQQRVGEDER